MLTRGMSRMETLTRAVRTGPVSVAASMMAAHPNTPAGTRRVKLACGSCGHGSRPRIVTMIDEHPSGTRFPDYPGLRLVARSGNVTRRHLQAVSCPEHGRLRAQWTDVLPAAAAAARDGRVRTLRLRQVSPAT